MSVTIKRWDNGEAIATVEDAETVRDAVVRLVAKGADLSYAKLNGAKLNYAELNGAELNDAELNDAELNGAKLNGAELNGAELNGANGLPPAPAIDKIDAKILASIEAGGILEMGHWHGVNGACGTDHCRAGWAIHHAGIAGQILEHFLGPETAGELIYRASRPGQMAPDFHCGNDEALADIRKCAVEQLAATK